MLSLGKEQTIRVGDKSWKLSRLTKGIIKGFRDYIAEQLGNYWEHADKYLDKVSPEDARAMIAEVKDTKQQLESFSLQCPLAKRFMATEMGMSTIFGLLLQEHHPDATEGDAFAIMMHLGDREETSKVLAKAAGEIPAKND